MRQLRVPVLVTAVAMLLAACSSGGDDASATPISEIGEGEGELNLVIWTGYAERGEADAAYDWVTPFEEETGCIVNTTDMTDSNNGVSLIQSGEYDGISASGDATTRLIASGLAAPIDTSVFENYDAVFDSLKNLPHNTVDGVNYGVPHGRGANVLVWNTDVVTEAPTSWDIIWEQGADYAGDISIYDSSIFIADAALHLMADAAGSGDREPVPAEPGAVRRVDRPPRGPQRERSALLGSRGRSDRVTRLRRRHGRHDLAVPGEQRDDGSPVEATLPDEGSTGWSDTWMMYSEAAHPNCMLMWMDHMMSAEANAQATVWFGEAPTSDAACDSGRGDLARPLRHVPRHRRGVLRSRLVLEHSAGGLRR